MDAWIEERAEAIRLAVRCPGLPGEAGTLRLLEWLEGVVTLRHGSVPSGSCLLRPGRAPLVLLPQRWQGRAYTEEACHELGHALCSAGIGPLLRQLAPGDPQWERLARRWDAQDEARAAAFVMAWLLPSVQAAEPTEHWELAEAAGCEEGLVRRRRERLRGEVVRITAPPRWSAWQRHEVVLRAAGQAPLLYVVRRGHAEPVWALPVTRRGAEDSARQVGADLIALTDEEFGRKYQPFHCGPRQAVEWDADALAEWSARSSG